MERLLSNSFSKAARKPNTKAKDDSVHPQYANLRVKQAITPTLFRAILRLTDPLLRRSSFPTIGNFAFRESLLFEERDISHQTATLLWSRTYPISARRASVSAFFWFDICALSLCDLLHLKLLVECGISELFQLESCIPLSFNYRCQWICFAASRLL